MSKKLQYACLDTASTNDISDKFADPKFKLRYIKCKGCVLPEYFKSIGDKIQELEIRDDDVWVCTFPKSGTTWTQEMVWCVGNDLDFKGAEVLIPQRFPFLEAQTLLNSGEHTRKTYNPTNTLPHYLLNSLDYVNQLPSPRFIKTHLPFNLLPEKLQNNTTKAKMIYTNRNPRDLCVSYHYHYNWMGFTGSFEQFCSLFLQGNVLYGPYWNHALQFWEQRNNPNLLMIKFEDMKEDLKSTIYKTASYLGKTLSEDKVEQLIDHLSFASMKRNKAVNYECYAMMRGNFIRRGIIGEWKEVMSEEMCDKFQKWEEEHLQKNK